MEEYCVNHQSNRRCSGWLFAFALHVMKSVVYRCILGLPVRSLG